MVLTYDCLHEHPRLCHALTSLTPTEFMLLLLDFQLAWELHEIESYLDSCPRQRGPGGGRKAPLQRLEAKLLFILVYWKLYPLQVVQGFLFGMSQGQANHWSHRLTPVLRTALHVGRHLPERNATALAHHLEAHEDRIALIDGTGRRRQRPKEKATQTICYSGKKKCHSEKNVLITALPRGKVDYLSQTYPGSRHDKAIADAEPLISPEGLVLGQDTGFQGYAPPGVIICQPTKTPKGGHLTAEEKARNRLIAQLRISMEHVIAGVKRCHIVKDLFRNTTQDFEDIVMEIACGLHNFRVAYRTQAAPS